MPLFRSKFSPVKYPIRKKLPFHSEKPKLDNNQPITLKLGSQEVAFISGQWQSVSEVNSDLIKHNEQLQLLSKNLREENNLLKLKVDILINMMAQQVFEMDKQEGKMTIG